MAALAKIDWTEVESGNVQEVGYHEPTKTLVVRFHNGGLYSYDQATKDTFLNLVHAESVGRYLNNVVKVFHPNYHKWNDETEIIDHINSL